jgi:hypothetical protein
MKASPSMTGAELARIQVTLANEWSTRGPDETFTTVQCLDRDTLELLVMANIGATVIRRG